VGDWAVVLVVFIVGTEVVVGVGERGMVVLLDVSVLTCAVLMLA
jgi:hypothetical protein